MLRSRCVAAVFAVMILGASVVCGQDYPNKPIRIVVGAAGGGADFVARMVATAISGPLGQPVVVDNRTAIQASEVGAKALPDGYTLHIAGGATWIAPLLHKTSYDVVRDFSPITIVVREVLMVAVHPSVPVTSVKELIAMAKAQPGQLNYAAGVIGSTPHLAAELFKHMAGVNIVRIPFKGSGPALVGLIGGEAQMMITDVGLLVPHAKSGKLKVLAVTSAEPSALAPGMPTVSAAGLPGYEAVSMTGLFAPARTPGAIINRLNQEIVRALNRTDVKERFLSAGTETVGSSPEQFAAALKSDIDKLGKVIRDAGIKSE